MNVLLVGEYSGLHTILAKELKNKNIDVFLVHDGDGYKSIKGADLVIDSKYYHPKTKIDAFIVKVLRIFLDFFGFKGFFSAIRNMKKINQLKNYDVVQLVNTKPFGCYGAFANMLYIFLLIKNNKQTFLLAAGDDYFWVKYCISKKPKYSMFDNFNFKRIKHFLPSFMYVFGLGDFILNKYVVHKVRKIIPVCYDYYIAYKYFDVKKITDIIEIPIERKDFVKSFKFKGYPLKIFHGWQPNKELRKGNDLFDSALNKLVYKYSDLIEYKVVSGVDYQSYQRSLLESDIFIDQCYSYDIGINALLGLREGKVVFSGYENDSRLYYKYDANLEPFVINAIPKIDDIHSELEELILNPQKLEVISLNAIKYVDKYRDVRIISNRFINIWMN